MAGIVSLLLMFLLSGTSILLVVAIIAGVIKAVMYLFGHR